MALSIYVNDIIWLRRFLSEAVHHRPYSENYSIVPTEIEIDSTAASPMAMQSGPNNITKHIAIIYHHVRDQIKMNTIQLFRVETNRQIGDCLTKPSSAESLHRLISTFQLQPSFFNFNINS